ncbi:NAD(P)-binding protein [Hymenobacter lapidarius]|uniref:NAD(P)-binding protein n=1 Tax=Hymenobacter lapidarius TaxID=1908237 RepID=UPI0026CB4609|nr:NAD(P)-binding protein [Hymenobacter lapidarius]
MEVFTTDVLVIGAGQSGLAVGYYLRRSGRAFAMLDAAAGPGARGRTPGIRCGFSRRPMLVPCPAGSCPVPPMMAIPPGSR